MLLVVALFALRLWWGRDAERRLRRALDPVVAAGLPARMADIKRQSLTDEVNAAAYLRKASASIVFNDSPAASSFAFPNYPPYGSQWDALAEKSVAQNAKIFPLARQARVYDRADWGTRFVRPAVSTLLPHLNDARHLANTLGDAALYAHFRGDDAAALEIIRDIRHEAKVLGHDPFVISHLVTVGIEMLAQDRLQVIAAGLRIAPDGAPPVPAGTYPTTAPSPPPRPATREQVRALIAELLDDGAFGAALVTAYAGERAMQIDTADWLGEKSWVLRPMFQLESVRMAEEDEPLLEAAAQPSWPAAKAVLASAALRRPPPGPPLPAANVFSGRGTPPTNRDVIDYTRLLSSNLLGTSPMGRPITQHMRARNEKRLTAVSLAAQLYRADHGTWPPSIDALVPSYLSQAPRDALAPDEKPLGYVLLKGALPEGGDRPLVYSVGHNGVDDAAAGTPPPNAPISGWQNQLDEWRDLTRWTPAPPATTSAPSTQAADDKADKSNDPGKRN